MRRVGKKDPLRLAVVCSVSSFFYKEVAATCSFQKRLGEELCCFCKLPQERKAGFPDLFPSSLFEGHLNRCGGDEGLHSGVFRFNIRCGGGELI